MYKSRQKFAQSISKQGHTVAIAGQYWSIKQSIQLKSQLKLLAQQLKYVKSLDLSEFHLPIKFNSKKLIHVGPVESELDFLSQYKMALVVENEPTYLSEKLFNSLFAGTIPIYFGADLSKYSLPNNIFVDLKWIGIDKLGDVLSKFDLQKELEHRENIRSFICSSSTNYWRIESGIMRLAKQIFELSNC
jgi:hypothetical protein